MFSILTHHLLQLDRDLLSFLTLYFGLKQKVIREDLILDTKLLPIADLEAQEDHLAPLGFVQTQKCNHAEHEQHRGERFVCLGTWIAKMRNENSFIFPLKQTGVKCASIEYYISLSMGIKRSNAGI